MSEDQSGASEVPENEADCLDYDPQGHLWMGRVGHGRCQRCDEWWLPGMKGRLPRKTGSDA